MKKFLTLAALAASLTLGACTGPSAGDMVDGKVVQFDGSLVAVADAPAGTITRMADNRCTFFGKFRYDETAHENCKLGANEAVGKKDNAGYIVKKN